MAAMFYGIISTEPAGLIIIAITAYKRTNFKLLVTDIT